MSSLRNPANALKAIARISVRNAANVRKEVTAGHMRDASNVLRDLASVGGMTVTASPDNAFGYGDSHGSIAISTGITTVTVAGGTAPYTYSWATGGATSAVSPTSATTVFRGFGVAPGDHIDDTASCTVTDALGTVAASNSVYISIDNYGT
jgi:hypothetical protein